MFRSKWSALKTYIKITYGHSRLHLGIYVSVHMHTKVRKMRALKGTGGVCGRFGGRKEKGEDV